MPTTSDSRTVVTTAGLMLALLVLATPPLRGEDAPLAEPAPAALDLNAAAEQFVRLALALGEHDAEYVDAYYGPEAWREEATKRRLSLPAILEQAVPFHAALRTGSAPVDAEARRRYLERHTSALISRAHMLTGTLLSFDDESRALFDTAAPARSDAYFRERLARLDALLPGEGPVSDRYESWRAQYSVPPDRVKEAFESALQESRRCTRAHLSLPEEERVETRYLQDKPWSAFNHYQGDFVSVVDVNLDTALTPGKLLRLATHEAYPGHHVFKVLREQRLREHPKEVELCLHVLYGPSALIAEGTANGCMDLVFPMPVRVEFLREKLFPLAGFDPDEAVHYAKVEALAAEVEDALVEAARRYVDGRLTAHETTVWLARHSRRTEDNAQGVLRYFQVYRSYVIGYFHGRTLVEDHMATRAGPEATPIRRWEVFGQILDGPRLPSEFVVPKAQATTHDESNSATGGQD